MSISESEEERPGVADLPGTYNRFFIKGKGGPAAALHSTSMYYKVIKFSYWVAISRIILEMKGIMDQPNDVAWAFSGHDTPNFFSINALFPLFD